MPAAVWSSSSRSDLLNSLLLLHSNFKTLDTREEKLDRDGERVRSKDES